MIPCLVPEIEGGYPERDRGEEGEGAEGLVLTYSSRLILFNSSLLADPLEPFWQKECGLSFCNCTWYSSQYLNPFERNLVKR